MTKTYLLLVYFIMLQKALCWNTKHFTTGLYEEMNNNGSLNNLKNLTYSVSVDWDDMKNGMK